MPASPADNPVLAAWTGPRGGVPPFNLVRTEHFAPALDEAIALQNGTVHLDAATGLSGTYSSAEARIVSRSFTPPTMSNLPSFRSVAVCEDRGVVISRVRTKVEKFGS